MKFFADIPEYIYDPEHSRRPLGGNWHKTEKGWSTSRNEDPKSNRSVSEIKKAINGDKEIFHRLGDDVKFFIIKHHDKNISKAVNLRRSFISKYGNHWYKQLDEKEKRVWGRANQIMIDSILWAKNTIGGDRWWNLPCVRKERDSHRNEVETVYLDTRERIEMRDSLAVKLYGKGSEKKERKLFMVMGLPGAGKSQVVVNRIKAQTSALEVDADMVKEHLPEFNGGSGAGIVHRESANIAENKIFAFCRENGDNVVFPTVGKNPDKMKKHIEAWKKAGYEVHLSLVDIDINSSIERALRRWVQSGRFVDPEYITYVGNHPKTTFESVKMLADSYEHWNNEVPMGTPPKLIDKKNKTAKVLTKKESSSIMKAKKEEEEMDKMILPTAELDTDRMTKVMAYFDQIKTRLGISKLSVKQILYYANEFENKERERLVNA